MDLHSEIMNISVKHETISCEVGNPRDYKLGHRDARHAAAELSLKADARIDELEKALNKFLIQSAPLREEWADMDDAANFASYVLENK